MDLLKSFLTDPPLAEALARLPEYVWAALASAVATLALTLGFAPRRARGGAAAPAPEGSCDFLIHGGALQPLTEAARGLVADLAPAPSRLAALRLHLAAECPGIEAELEGLILFGVGFRQFCQRSDGGAYEVSGAPRGAAAFLSLRPASEEAQALRDAERALAQAREEARFLGEALDRAPILAWSLAPDGQVAWANAGYCERFAPSAGELPDHRIPDAFSHVLEEVPLTARGGGSRRRVSVPGPQDSEPHWFELSQNATPGGETLGFALEADDLVAAEGSLRRFIETLTETFAHLPIGLAVFDKNRRLGLFNPALTDLVRIDAVWLAGRPSLRDFLERLRETRQMPEQKDFTSWRRKLGELEEGARDGTYEENWVLPSGKILRVTGRPHPQGALAFLFEDISTSIQLERRYRSELELSQATLDRMVEAVAVFDTSGMLVFVNSAFEALWDVQPMQRLDGPGVAEMTGLWAERCQPSPAWSRICEFATGGAARAAWSDAIETRDGRLLQVLVAPLPDASALVVFRCLGEESAALAATRDALETRHAARDQDALLHELAQARIELPVEAAVARMAAAIPAVGSPEALNGLASAAQGLKDGLAQSRALREIAQGAEGGGPAAGLAGLLRSRGLALELDGEDAVDRPERRRSLWAVALAAAEVAAPDATVRISAAADGATFGVTARLHVAAGETRGEGVGLALARTMLAGLGGTLVIEPEAEGGHLSIRASLPGAVPDATLALRA